MTLRKFYFLTSFIRCHSEHGA